MKKGLFREETLQRESVSHLESQKRHRVQGSAFILGRGGDFQELGHQLLFDLREPGVCRLAC